MSVRESPGGADKASSADRRSMVSQSDAEKLTGIKHQERRAGELLSRIERQQGKRDGGSELHSTMERSEISPVTAHRWQVLATIPVIAAEMANMTVADGAKIRESSSTRWVLDRKSLISRADAASAMLEGAIQ